MTLLGLNCLKNGKEIAGNFTKSWGRVVLQIQLILLKRLNKNRVCSFHF